MSKSYYIMLISFVAMCIGSGILIGHGAYLTFWLEPEARSKLMPLFMYMSFVNIGCFFVFALSGIVYHVKEFSRK